MYVYIAVFAVNDNYFAIMLPAIHFTVSVSCSLNSFASKLSKMKNFANDLTVLHVKKVKFIFVHMQCIMCNTC